MVDEEFDRPTFDLGFQCFKDVSKYEKCKILEEQNRQSTNSATKQMLRLFVEYLLEKIEVVSITRFIKDFFRQKLPATRHIFEVAFPI